VLELRPSTFNPPNVWLGISRSFVEVNGSRKAFPEAGILDGHLNRGDLALKAPRCRGICRICVVVEVLRHQKVAPRR
jgi:hypothetical protein